MYNEEDNRCESGHVSSANKCSDKCGSESAALDEPEIVIELRDVLSVGMWWSSAKRENFNRVTHFRIHFVVKTTRITTPSFTHLQ